MTDSELISGLVEFARELRAAGVAVDTARIAVAAAALTELGPLGRDDIYWGMRLALCSRATDLPLFDGVFAAWFHGTAVAAELAAKAAPIVTIDLPAAGSADEAGAGEIVGGASNAAGAGAAAGAERLTDRDVRTLTAAERAEINALIALLSPVTRTRRSMRRVAGGRAVVDVGRTVRAMVRNGGEPVRLHYRRRTDKPRRLVLLIDVSKSMNLYSDALLRFAHAAVSAGPATTEVFTLGTRCMRITSALRARDPNLAMSAVAGLESGWGGGTLLGRTLTDFLRLWGGRSAVRSAIVVIASDGCEFGDPLVLSRQVARLSRLAHVLIWVNPQQGWAGFQPKAPGLVQSLPFVHERMAGHSFEALRDLAEMIAR
jgi:uncharacterized protein with von Willebrand factor type A (vWA) domain